MIYINTSKLFLICCVFVCVCLTIIEVKSIPVVENALSNAKTRSDAILTSRDHGIHGYYYTGPIAPPSTQQIDDEPGWMRRQLLKMGEYTSSIGNALGGFTSKVANALDKVCELIKTIIPVMAAICYVGQFEFCSAMDEAPQELAAALAPNSFDLSFLD